MKLKKKTKIGRNMLIGFAAIELKNTMMKIKTRLYEEKKLKKNIAGRSFSKKIPDI